MKTGTMGLTKSTETVLQICSMRLILSLILLHLMINLGEGRFKGKNDKEKIGVVLLDAVTFPKVVPQASKSVMVLISAGASDGDYGADSIRIDFLSFAEKSQLHGSSDAVLFAQLVVNEEESENAIIAEKLGMAPDFIHPAIFFYPENSDTPIRYPAKNQVNHIALARWLSKQVDQYFLPTAGLIESYGVLVARFMVTADKEQQKSIIQQATVMAPSVELKDKENAKTYIKFMQRISDRGSGFVKAEIQRLEDLITSDRISKPNQILLQRKVNILHIFDRKSVHDEL